MIVTISEKAAEAQNSVRRGEWVSLIVAGSLA
jgi:hypothetical protein